ncbi:MAG TPA: hypothetical protein VMT15_14085 [Bryobacteraceae bacterium]|nr:hypothetical protein [Bryobacteraceae bacterium]
MNLIFFVSVAANVVFALIVGATGFFLIRSVKDGYWGKRGEDIKYLIFDEDGKRKDS